MILSLNEFLELLIQLISDQSLLVEVVLLSLLLIFVKLPLCRDSDLFLNNLVFDV